MNAMTRFDLMLGDLVEHNGAPARIVELYIDQACLWPKDAEYKNDYRTVPYHELAPLPITPEILRENHFELIEVGDNGPLTPPEHRNRYEKWKWPGKTIWVDVVLWYDRAAKTWFVSGLNGTRFKHVHELQHALKLAGSDKTIEML